MTVGVSTTNVANKWLDVIRTSGTSFTAVTSAWVRLHTGDPGASGTANGSAGDTTRKAVTHNAASSGSITINGEALSTGDALMLRDEAAVSLSNGDNAEVLVFDLPRQ